MPQPKLIAQGAEAKIFLKGDEIIKDRIAKSYRLPELDIKIRKGRTKAEAKLLDKVAKIIPAPQPLEIPKAGRIIRMPYIEGKKLSQHLDNLELKQQKQICQTIGEQTAKIHDANLIHGDLTTSNMILTEDNKLYFIDFGLGFHSRKFEDKAVDLHLIKQALEAKHFQNWKILWKEIQKGYSKSKDAEKTLNQLQAVEKRGRYRH